jgi:mono/diheme cytochrome c family protein
MRALVKTTTVAIALGLLTAAVPAGAVDYPFSTLQRGKSLVDAGDCVACHTADKSRPFAGGRAIATPFGTIFSANITPDRDTGIGAWNDDDFYRAMHEGRGARGERLYPAFPYPYFTRLTRQDVDAIRAYLMSLAPVRNTPPRNRLTWPLNYRVLMAGWNLLFFKPSEFAPNPQKSAEWNRGAYLVEGPGHCGACHTAKNVFGADKSSEALQGASIQDWTAPKLVGDQRDGLGRWSGDDVAEYLKTGRNKFSGATGLMAIATYLKDMPGQDEASASTPGQAEMKAGQAIYEDSCAACHQASGEGVAHMFPPLKADAVAQQANASTVVRIILEGAMTAPTAARPTPSAMPAFAWKLDDAQAAAVATYVRNAWGNKAAPVTAGAVADMRKAIDSVKAGPQTVGSGVKLHEQN